MSRALDILALLCAIIWALASVALMGGLAGCEPNAAALCPGGRALFSPKSDITAFELAMILERAPRPQVVCLKRGDAIPEPLIRHFVVVP